MTAAWTAAAVLTLAAGLWLSIRIHRADNATRIHDVPPTDKETPPWEQT